MTPKDKRELAKELMSQPAATLRSFYRNSAKLSDMELAQVTSVVLNNAIHTTTNTFYKRYNSNTHKFKEEIEWQLIQELKYLCTGDNDSLTTVLAFSSIATNRDALREIKRVPHAPKIVLTVLRYFCEEATKCIKGDTAMITSATRTELLNGSFRTLLPEVEAVIQREMGV